MAFPGIFSVEMKRLRFSIAVTLVTFLVSPLLGIQASAAELGIGFRVVPTGGKVGGNNQLWFALDRGESGIRKFEVISSSDISQLIQLTFVQAQTVDGQLVAGSEPSEIANWIFPDANNFILKPRESRMIEISTKVPPNTEDGTYRAYLKVGASAAKDTKARTDVTQAVVKNAISFNKELYVLVGNAENLTLDFEILGLQDFTKDDGSKNISIDFRNLGQVPLGLKANLTLVSTEFSNLSYGPFIGGSTTMLEEGDEGYAELKLPDEVAPGSYRILVQASQDSVIKNKVFEEELTFPRLGGFKVLPILIALVLLALGILLFRFGLKKIRNQNQIGEDYAKQLKKTTNSQDDFDVDAFLDEILAKNQRKRQRAEKRKESIKSVGQQRKGSRKSQSSVKKSKIKKKSKTKVRSR